MKLNELLETVHELTDKIGQVRMTVTTCDECKKGTTQEEHSEKHLEEALKIRDKLPYNLVWAIGMLELKPMVKLTIDEEGHVIADLEEVEIN